MKHTLTIVSLGPGAGEHITLAALAAMKAAGTVLLRTARTPAVQCLDREHISYTSLDARYDETDDFDTLNGLLADSVQAALEQRDVVYAVLDAGDDESVRALMERIPDARLLPGVGTFEPLRLRHPDALAVPATRLPDALGDQALLIVEIDSALLAGDLKLRLMDWFGDHCPCLFYPPSAETDRAPVRIPLTDMDRQKRYDHTAALYIAPEPLTDKERFTVQDLVRVMQVLRGPDGCPWDREQTHESLRPYLVEEAYEVTEAIRDEDWLHVADELGDVLLQVVFQANIGDQYGTLTLSDISTAICRKMIRRHPHIFGRVQADTPEEVSRNWDAIKRAERGQQSAGDVLNDIPRSLPPLMRAQKAIRKAAGFTQDAEKVTPASLTALAEQLARTPSGAPAAAGLVGSLLFETVREAQARGVDCETALADTTEAFIRYASRDAAGSSSPDLSKISQKT